MLSNRMSAQLRQCDSFFSCMGATDDKRDEFWLVQWLLCMCVCVTCRHRANSSQLENLTCRAEYLLLSRGSCNVATHGSTIRLVATEC